MIIIVFPRGNYNFRTNKQDMGFETNAFMLFFWQMRVRYSYT